MEDHGSPALRRLLDALPDAVLETHAQLGDATAVVERDAHRSTCCASCATTASSHFDMLSDV